MNTVSLQPLTRDTCHEFFKSFQNDPALYMDMSQFVEYVYIPENVDRYYDNNMTASRRLFAIMNNERVIGEGKLKEIDLEKRECSMGIHLMNDSVKGKGNGAQAVGLLLQYAFLELGMRAVNADAVLKNKRSQHILGKAGFDFVKQEGIFRYYQITRRGYDEQRSG